MPLLRLILLSAVVLLPALPLAAQANGLIVLVRHAETAPDGTRNPPLSPEGLARAGRLAELLADARLDAVYSTAYLRTRATAGAVAERSGVEVSDYDPGALAAFADAVRARGGRVLVVGHSNTTPPLVGLLGGDPGPPIVEDEHDRVYILYPEGDAVRTLLLRLP